MTFRTMSRKAGLFALPIFVLAGLADPSAAGPSAPSSPRGPVALGTAIPTRQILETQLGGPVVRSAHIGQIAYVAAGARIHSLDLSNPERPISLGSSTILPSVVNDLVAADGVLFVAHDDGLTVLDAHQPRLLPELDSLQIPGGAGDVTWHDHYAYVADLVVDVAVPTDLLVVGEFGTSGPQSDVAVVERTLYGVKGSTLTRFDIAHGEHPVERESAYLGHDAKAVAADGRNLFVGRPSDLIALDTLNLQAIPSPTPIPDWKPSTVQEGPLAIVPTEGGVEHIVLQGDLAFVAAGDSGGLRILDISDRSAIQTLSVTQLGSVGHIDLMGDIALVAAGGEGLKLVDVRDPASPRVLPVNPVPAWSQTLDVAWQGSVAMVAAGASGLVSLDMADPLRPRLLAKLAIPGGAERLAWSHGAVFTVAGDEGDQGWLNVIAVTDPSRPWLMATRRTAGSAEAVEAADGRVYVADGRQGLGEWDVEHLDAPIQVRAWGYNGSKVTDVAVSGDQAYVADATIGLRVFNLSLGRHEAEIGRIGFFSRTMSQGILLSGDSLWVVGSFTPERRSWESTPQGLLRIDVSNPRRPRIIEELDASTMPRDVQQSGATTFIASSNEGDWLGRRRLGPKLHAIDRVDTAKRWEARVPGGLHAIAVQANLALLAADRGGVVVGNLADDLRATNTPALSRNPAATSTRRSVSPDPSATLPRIPTMTAAPRGSATPEPVRERAELVYLPWLACGERRE